MFARLLLGLSKIFQPATLILAAASAGIPASPAAHGRAKRCHSTYGYGSSPIPNKNGPSENAPKPFSSRQGETLPQFPGAYEYLPMRSSQSCRMKHIHGTNLHKILFGNHEKVS
jgi:hypothetical protein